LTDCPTPVTDSPSLRESADWLIPSSRTAQ
jgi:hypothetical protein